MNINDKVNFFYKECTAGAPAVAGIAMMLAPFVSYFAQKAKSASSIQESLNKVISNLEEYKSEYTFEKYDSYLNSFLLDCKNLLSLYNKVLVSKDGKEIKPFLELAYKVEVSGQSAKVYLDDLKGIAGKAFDVAKTFSLNLGLDTAATATSDAINDLSKHLAIERPKLELEYKKIIDKINSSTNNSENNEPTEFDEFASLNF